MQRHLEREPLDTRQTIERTMVHENAAPEHALTGIQRGFYRQPWRCAVHLCGTRGEVAGQTLGLSGDARSSYKC